MSFDFRNLKPYLRYSYIASSRYVAGVYKQPLYAYDNRLFYVLEGTITLSIEDKGNFVLGAGDCAVFRPGLGYRVLENGFSRFVISSFDYDDAAYGCISRHPALKESFNPEEIFSVYNPKLWQDVFVCRGTLSVQGILVDMCKTMRGQSPYKFDFASGILKSVIVELYRISEERKEACGMDDLSLKIKNYIDSNYTANITNQSVGQHFGYHPYYVNGVFKKSMGTTLHCYITDKRISMAKSLLADTVLSVEEISEQCGFSSGTYFAECFKAKTGMTAMQFRKSCK